MNTFAIHRPDGELEDLLAAVPDSAPARTHDEFLPSFDEFMPHAADQLDNHAHEIENEIAPDRVAAEARQQAYHQGEPEASEQPAHEPQEAAPSPSPFNDLAQMLVGIEMRARAHSVPKALLLLDEIAALCDDPEWDVAAGECLMKILDLIPGQQVKR